MINNCCTCFNANWRWASKRTWRWSERPKSDSALNDCSVEVEVDSTFKFKPDLKLDSALKVKLGERSRADANDGGQTKAPPQSERSHTAKNMKRRQFTLYYRAQLFNIIMFLIVNDVMLII